MTIKNSYLLSVLFFLSHLGIFGQDTINFKWIEHAQTEFHCAFIEDLHVIRNQDQFDSLVAVIDTNCLKSSPAPAINFKKNTLVGFGAGASGCGTPIIGLKFEKKNKKTVVVHIKITSSGLCKGYFYGKTWCVIPKVSNRTDFEVDINRVHLTTSE